MNFEKVEISLILEKGLSTRSQYLRQIKELFFVHFLKDYPELFVIVKEIIKNIYDHANGRGEIKFERDSSGIIFIIKDFGDESYNYDYLMREPSSKRGNGINYGIGLEAIVRDSKLQQIELAIDTSRGFKYILKKKF